MGSGGSANAKYKATAAAPRVLGEPVDSDPPSFKTTLPEGSLPGQTVQVTAPDGRLVEVVVPEKYLSGQPLRVNLTEERDSSKASTTPALRSKEEEIIDFVRVLEKDADSARVQAQQHLANELQLQKVLWASAETAGMRGASLLDQLTGVEQAEQLQGLVFAAATRLEQAEHLQALVFAAAMDGDAAQLLAALEEAKRGCEVSASLEVATRELRSAEEALLTWRCLREALLAQDRPEIQAWLEQAISMGFDAPEGIDEVLDSLYKKEHADLEQRRAAEQRLRFAQEAGDSELLAQVEAEAAECGVYEPPNSGENQTASAEVGERSPVPEDPETAAARGTEEETESKKTRSNHDQKMEEQQQQREEQPDEGQQDEAPKEERGCEQDAEQHDDEEQKRRQREQREGEQEYPKARAKEEEAKKHTDSADSTAEKEEQTESNRQQQEQGIHALSTKELIEECRRRGLDTKTCSTREDLLDLLQRSPEPDKQANRHSEKSGGADPTPPAEATPQKAAATHCVPPPSVSVWGRLSTPAQWKVHKQYETLYLLGFDLTKLREMPTAAELRSAYRKAAMESHPDKAQNHDRQKEAKELFQRVREAFDYLSELT